MLHWVEVQVSSRLIFLHMSEMRTWLDHQRYEPDYFGYHSIGQETIIAISFKFKNEAEAFAAFFGGVLTELS